MGTPPPGIAPSRHRAIAPSRHRAIAPSRRGRAHVALLGSGPSAQCTSALRGGASARAHGRAGCGTDPGDVVDVHGVVADERHHQAVGHLLDRAAQHLDGPHACTRRCPLGTGGSGRFLGRGRRSRACFRRPRAPTRAHRRNLVLTRHPLDLPSRYRNAVPLISASKSLKHLKTSSGGVGPTTKSGCFRVSPRGPKPIFCGLNIFGH